MDQASSDMSSGEKPKSNAAKAFDIAKFCGIFAAIGMAMGYLGSFLTSVGGAIVEYWKYLPLAFLGLILIISGPSMLSAYFKLRRRNLGPVLNANGWAINAKVIVNTRFGVTMTSVAEYPVLLDKRDPYADKGMSPWLKALIWIVVILAVAALFVWLTRDASWAPWYSWFNHAAEVAAPAAEVAGEAVEAAAEAAAEVPAE